MRARSLAVLVFAAALSPGCGLLLDLDPPDVDAGGMDGGLFDAGGRDAGGCLADHECDDGDPCNGLELCLPGGACGAGEPIECDDGDVCNGLEFCSDGACVSGSGLACVDDSDPCNGDTLCDPTLGCIVTPEMDCDDRIDCTVDTCQPDGSCAHMHNDALCTEGPAGRCEEEGGCQYDVCELGVTCIAGPCETVSCAGTRCVRASRCSDDASCCGDTCVARGCSDDNPCTVDSCDGTSCVHTEVDMPCSDGDFCTVGDHCSGGVCAGLPRPCTDGNPCTADSCESVAARCVNTPADGAVCSDGNACTGGDTCSGGRCEPGLDLTACPELPCRVGMCDPVTGLCAGTNSPAGTSCGVGRTCDGAGRCRCPLGRSDCDDDGSCECLGVCGPGGGAGEPACVLPCTALTCGAGQTCCSDSASRDFGRCYDSRCLSCCTVSAET